MCQALPYQTKNIQSIRYSIYKIPWIIYLSLTIQTLTETAHIQILQKYVNVLTAYQIFHVNEIKTIQPIDQEITQL